MTLRSSRRPLAVAGMVVVALAAAACGGPSPLARSSSAQPATTAPSTAAPSTPAPAPTAPPPSSPSTTGPPNTVAPTTTVPPSPQESAKARALIAAAKRDALAERWAHVSATVGVTVAGPDRGTQNVTVDGVTGEIRVLPKATYIDGSALALERLFRVPAPSAVKLAGKWVILTPADPEYKSVTVDVTLPSQLQTINLSSPLRTEPYNQRGKRGTLISGSLATQPGTSEGYGLLLVTAGPHPLPVEYAEFLHTRQTVLEEMFSLWGASELVAAPAGAVPLPKTRGASARS